MSPTVDRRQRLQRQVLIAGALVVGAFLLVRFGLMAMIELRRTLEGKLVETTRRVEEATKLVNDMPRFEAEATACQANVCAVTNRYVLRQVLGSYPVQSEIHRVAAQGGFKVDYVREPGKQATPRAPAKDAKPKSASVRRSGSPGRDRGTSAEAPLQEDPAFARYAVEVGGSGSYADVVDLISRLEGENPFVGITELNIRGVVQSPERHRVVLRLEWPVDADAPPPSVTGGRRR